MNEFIDGIRQAFELIVTGDDTVIATTRRTLRIGLESTAIAAALGIPLGAVTGLRRFRGRRLVLGLANAGLRTPPVALGMGLWLLMWPHSLWGGGLLSGLGWIYTTNAVVLAQTLLVLPIVVALTAAAVQGVPAELVEQARAFGAPGRARSLLALREARIGVVAAIIAAFGSAVASVGAVLIIGSSLGNATLVTASLSEWNMGGSDARAVAFGTVALGMFLIVAAGLTVAQQRHRPWFSDRAS